MLTNELRAIYTRLIQLSKAGTLTVEQRSMVLAAGFVLESVVEHVLPKTAEGLAITTYGYVEMAYGMVNDIE